MVLMSAILCLICLAIFMYFFATRSRYWQCLEDIPQPPSYPIIGNFFDLMRPPDKVFAEDRARSLKYYPIYKLQTIHLAAVFLINPEDIELVLTDMNHITKSVIYDFLHSWLGTGLLTSTGTKWHSRRKILTPAFHFTILPELINIFNKETKRLVEDLKKECHKPFIDVVVPITHFTLLSTGESVMGINLDISNNDKSGYKSAVYRMGQIITYRAHRPYLINRLIYALTTKNQEEKILIETLHKFTNKVIAEKKKNLTTSSYSTRKRLAMLDLLLKYQIEGVNIDDEGIREEVDTFMFEGHDTISMALCFGLMLLANHKDTQEEIFNEIKAVLGEEAPNYTNLNELKFLERCIKEILRLYPSVPFISRVSGREIKTKTGYTIPEGCIIGLQIYDLHHNPNVFPDPEKFDPDRFLPENIQKRHPFAYVPFSAGPRNCIGQKFAMLEMKTALAGVLKNFVLEPVDTPKDIVFVADVVLRPKSDIKVKFVPRHNRN